MTSLLLHAPLLLLRHAAHRAGVLFYGDSAANGVKASAFVEVSQGQSLPASASHTS